MTCLCCSVLQQELISKKYFLWGIVETQRIGEAGSHVPVSYTHLDVYKRQPDNLQQQAQSFKK